MKIYLYLIAIILFCVCTDGKAQNKTINGVVIDQTGKPLIGAVVGVPEIGRGVITDQEGEFQLTLPNEVDSVEVQYVGKKKLTLKVQSYMQIVLSDDQSIVDEVVVVGYGQPKEVGSIVGSYEQINLENLENSPHSNVFDALQGKAAGLQVFTNSGEPSAVPTIRIRGKTSLALDSEPLILLDGVQVTSSSLKALNPNDFESVTVMKDAAATSIYGTRAANGVIYITTKEGKAGKGQISVSTQLGFSAIANDTFFDNLMTSEQLGKFWVDIGYNTQHEVDSILAANPNNFSWYEYYYRQDAPTSSTNLSFSGGGEDVRYFISGGYFKQEGMSNISNLDRYTARVRVDSDIKDWLSANINLSLGYTDVQSNPFSPFDPNGSGLFFLTPPFLTPYDENGDRYDGRIPNTNIIDPFYQAEKRDISTKTFQLNPQASIAIKPIENMVFTSNAGLNTNYNKQKNKTLPSFLNSNYGSTLSNNFNDFFRFTLTNTLEYDFDLGDKNEFSILGGHEYVDSDTQNFLMTGSGATDDRLTFFQENPDSRFFNEDLSENALSSYFGNVHYNFDDRYHVFASIRNDGSSSFLKSNNRATFWSSGVRWRLENESFLQALDWLNSLNAGVNYGTTGNSPTSGYSTYTTVSGGNSNRYQGQNGWAVRGAGNPALEWEETAELNASVKMRLFNKLGFEFDYYDRVTNKAIHTELLPLYSGFSVLSTNVGELENKGVELSLDYTPLNTGEAFLQFYSNITSNRNKVLALQNNEQYDPGFSYVVGEELTFFRPLFAGINSETGDPEWYLPKEGELGETITTKDPDRVTSNYSFPNLRQNTGINTIPKYTGGFGLDASYKGVSLSAGFAYALEKYMANYDRFYYENPNFFRTQNQSANVMDFWKEPGDQARLPRKDVLFFTNDDSRLIEDASFLRLKNLSLGYDLKNNVLNNTQFVEKAEVFLQGRNLLTFTGYSGIDPEVYSVGPDTFGTYPNSKQITFGLDLTF